MIDISGLSREEKLEFIGRLWDDLTSMHPEIPLTEWQREEIDRRLDELDRDGPKGTPAEIVLGRLRGQNE